MPKGEGSEVRTLSLSQSSKLTMYIVGGPKSRRKCRMEARVASRIIISPSRRHLFPKQYVAAPRLMSLEESAACPLTSSVGIFDFLSTRGSHSRQWRARLVTLKRRQSYKISLLFKPLGSWLTSLPNKLIAPGLFTLANGSGNSILRLNRPM